MDLTALNEAQKKAVTYGDGPLLVLAGAGSGKTRVLTTRIAYLLLEKGVDPYNILAITFTNKAAREMRERIAAAVPGMARDLWVFTFHATCLRILRRQSGFAGFTSNFVIYDADDQKTVIKECLKELNLDDKKFPPQAMSAAISQSKNMLYGPAEMEKKSYDYFSQTACKVYKLYQEKLRQNNALDFDDLLMHTVHLLQNNPAVLDYYQEKFRYILVDEYQDTNHAQYVLVNLLAQKYRNICVVGDPDQGIYGWRGADIQNIMSFERDYPDAAAIVLEQNYRSTRTILESANAVIRHNRDRKEKKLWTAGSLGDPITVFTARDEHAEASYVVEQIRRWHSQMKKNYRDFAVLYRTNAQSRVLEEKFLAAGIPYTIVGGLRFYERKEIKDLLAYLRLLVNPNDRLSLRRVINEPKRGIGAASLNKILNWADETRQAPLTLLENGGGIPGLGGKAAGAARVFGQTMGDIKKRMPGLPITRLVQMVLEETGYWQALENERTVESRTRMENLREFYTVTGEYDASGEGGGLEDFLSSLALVTDLDNYEQDADQVTLMTMHSAKGLEFPVVFITGMEETVFPHSRSMEDRHELEEERRLCYVGITRAMEHLYLTHCWQRTLYGYTRMNEPSRFLRELPPDLLDTGAPLDNPEDRALSGKLPVAGPVDSACGGDFQEVPGQAYCNTPTGRSTGTGSLASPGGQNITYSTGERVYHRKWGQGIIKEVRGKGDNAELKIEFPGLGVKTLLARYAPLTR
ncbi:DNA helicase PcrA [Desulfallas thermosapovorans]|uniref:ATP-dependent DNA helicase n=1 Tax=Desulfallas thermosapovorans DSM 6562 TaxID=1121431 RepID=A0A5S4ZVM6_9FIRM|nr:DNA helicase PcrA [Desulfallas thermosapovorans]TYO96261.1 DNA helicase-2/ATP-dependent DNA helicase PcrA [Desulfallas thermosapovorans DSM 6562]